MKDFDEKAKASKMNTLKKFVSSFFDFPYSKSEQEEENFTQKSDYFNWNIYKNPMMCSFLTLKCKLELLCNKELSKSDKIKEEKNNRIKIQICEILIFIVDLRQDFLISNFLAWFKKLSPDYSELNESNVEGLLNLICPKIEKEIHTVLPTCLLTGIDSIDEKYPINNFFNYTEENEIQELDHLMTANFEVKLTILPNLLINFLLSNDDIHLQDKIFLLISKCYYQKAYFVEHLNNLQVLFDEKDISIFRILEKKIYKLKILTEKSEVKLIKFKKY